MRNIVKIGLMACFMLGLSGCAEKLSEEQTVKMSKFDAEQRIFSKDEKAIVRNQMEKIKPCYEFTTLKTYKEIKYKEYSKIYPVFNDNLSVNHIIENLSYKEGVEYKIEACYENNEDIKIIKLMRFYFPQDDELNNENESQQNMQ